jgi:hypothetical protein
MRNLQGIGRPLQGTQHVNDVIRRARTLHDELTLPQGDWEELA